MEAVIRKDGIVVRLEGIKNPIPNTDGYLIGFHSDSDIYFNYTDEGNYANYKEYVEYRNNARKLEDVKIFNEWKIAQNGDKIKIRKREVTYVSNDYNNHANDNKYKWLECEKDYAGESYSANGISTAGFQITSQLVNEQYFGANSSALEYFKRNIVLASVSNSEPDINKKLINVIANITQLIYNISDSVFKAFIAVDIDNPLIRQTFTNIRNQQDLFWRDLFVNQAGIHTLKELLEIYTKNYIILDEYYEQYCNFRNYIINHSDTNNASAEDIERLIYIAIPFSPAVLTLIPADLKIIILKYICSKKYINNFENFLSQQVDNNNSIVHTSGIFRNGKVFAGEVLEQFIVNLVYSVKESEVNGFLDDMLSTLEDGLVYIKEKTLYEIIYENLNESYNITTSLLQFSNLIFKTDFKPNTSKTAFAHAMYGLWMNSKYNPYSIDGNLKPNVIYIKSLENNKNKPITNKSFFVEDIPNTGVINTIFTYSYETAYQSTVGIHSGWPYEHVGDVEHFYTIKYSNAAPISIPYESEKRLGIFFDNFTFEFENKKIKVIQDKLPYIETEKYLSKYQTTSQLYGTYHIYQPVSLINNNVETKSPIYTIYGKEIEVGNGNLTINSLIPIFILKMIDDAGDRSDAETVLGYVVDGALTFSGIGNLTKLRHLRWAALGVNEVNLLSKAGLRVVFGGIEFSSGVIGFFANFVACNINDQLCKNMKNFIMLLQLATLSVSAIDTISTLALKRSAKKVIEAAGGESQLEQRLLDLNVGNDNTYLSEAAQTIKSCALIPLSQEKINKMIKRAKELVFIAAGDKIPPKFNISHWTNGEMEQFIKFAHEQGLSEDDIETFLFISGRKIAEGKDINGNIITIDKSFGKQEAIDRLNNTLYVTKPRNYPFGFENFDPQFKAVQTKLKQALEQAGLPTDNVYIGGSSLQKADPRDLDVYIVVGQQKLEELGEAVKLEMKRLGELNLMPKKRRENVKKSMASISKTNLIYGHQFYKLNGTGKSVKEIADDLGILSTAQPGKFPEGIEIILKAKIEESAFYMKLKL